MEINDLTIQEKIGQMIIIGIQEENISNKTLDMIRKYKFGGIILYKKNYKSYNEMLDVINKIKETNKSNKIPIFITIDQEGGRVNRMPPEIHNLKSATLLSKTNDIQKIRNAGSIIGRMLKQTGINMNYAPVLDIRRFEEGHAIGDRCYGENKEDVAKNGIEVMKEMQNKGVIPVIKHFPGHGTTKKDSHFRIPKIDEKIEIIENEDMYPFKKAIQDGVDAIMVGHLIVKDIDKKYPASLSKKIIKTYLKDKYNYKGLIITDDLKMWAVRLHYNMKKAVERAIISGNDMIMVGLSYSKIERILKYIYKRVKTDKIEILKIDESIEKIIKIKEKYNIKDNKVKGIDIEEINRKIDEINIE